MLMTEGENSGCFVTPLNRSGLRDPETLQKYLETHPVSFQLKRVIDILNRIY